MEVELKTKDSQLTDIDDIDDIDEYGAGANAIEMLNQDEEALAAVMFAADSEQITGYLQQHEYVLQNTNTIILRN